jgi:hypothetical protein
LIISVRPVIYLPRGGRKADLDNFDAVKKYIADIITRIELKPEDKGFMPFKHEKLTDKEIAAFKAWAKSGMTEK